MANSRLKDYFDLWTLTGHFDFDFEILRTAVMRTFARNDLTLPSSWPIGLRDDFATDSRKRSQWNAFLRKTQPQIRPATLTDAVSRIRLFLSPIIAPPPHPPLVWSPDAQQWTPAPSPAASP